VAATLTLFIGCEKTWTDYYSGDEVSDTKLWDAIKEVPEYSEFVDYLIQTGYDSLLNSPESFTLFIPPNDAFQDFNYTGAQLEWVLGYHVARTVFIPSNIHGQRKLETHIGKFAWLSRNENGVFFDELSLSDNSPLYKDGVFYEIEQIAYPRPNLYEYMSVSNPVLKEYIDSRDSISLDYELSIPIGFDDDGNTIYDSVFFVTNRFERDFFPVTQESRNNAATMILVTEEAYVNALNIMAGNLKGSFTDHNDIPLDWQYEFLLPNMFKNGTFGEALEYEHFITDSLKNIQGDLIPIDYTSIDPDSRYLCSNGIVFHYTDYLIPEELYLEEIRYEGEDLAIDVGGGFFAWDNERIISSDPTVSPVIYDHTSAAGGKYVGVNLPRGSTTAYSIQIKLPKIFPRKYTLTWRGNYRPSGVIAFYVNDEPIGEFDNYNFRYPVDGNNPVNGFNLKRFTVDNITAYNDVVVKMEYTGPGIGSLNGFNIDYISLTPAE
jgi:hypothetical protein